MHTYTRIHTCMHREEGCELKTMIYLCIQPTMEDCDGLCMLGPGSGTTRRCGLVGVGRSLVGGSEITVGVGFKTLLLAAWK